MDFFRETHSTDRVWSIAEGEGGLECGVFIIHGLGDTIG